MTGGAIDIAQAPGFALEVFLEKLDEMGHIIHIGPHGIGVSLKASNSPRAVSFRTMPYPGFPTDLQPPLMAAQCLASGVSVIQETVYENRMLHVRELQKMGAHISVEGQSATIKGIDELYGAHVIAPDIRASAALVIAGLVAQGKTVMTGIHHLKRGYQNFDDKLASLGARIKICSGQEVII
jgi:UDP-N-acetylglucosamine 1-carboxyvinyltransferase